MPTTTAYSLQVYTIKIEITICNGLEPIQFKFILNGSHPKAIRVSNPVHLELKFESFFNFKNL